MSDLAKEVRPCGCKYEQISARNTATLGGSWYVLKWIRTWRCMAHLDDTPQDA